MSRVTELAETAMAGCAPNATMFDLKVNVIAPSVDGDSLSADAKVVHAGRRTVVTECAIRARDGQLVATASATFAVTAK